MRFSRLALIPAAGLLVAACSSGGGATTAPSASASAPATRVEVKPTTR